MSVTANDINNMPRPLLDRMEIIRISGYTEDEKLQIAKKHLLKKQMKNAGLKAKEFKVSDNAIRELIRYYTREAGVRNLERELANLCRKSIKEILMKGKEKVSITPRSIGEICGCEEVPLWRDRRKRPYRCCDRSGLYRKRWRFALDRGGDHARQGRQGYYDRKPERRYGRSPSRWRRC